jgi:hypothetical protein
MLTYFTVDQPLNDQEEGAHVLVLELHCHVSLGILYAWVANLCSVNKWFLRRHFWSKTWFRWSKLTGLPMKSHNTTLNNVVLKDRLTCTWSALFWWWTPWNIVTPGSWSCTGEFTWTIKYWLNAHKQPYRRRWSISWLGNLRSSCGGGDGGEFCFYFFLKTQTRIFNIFQFWDF